jgi:hypothetical protein
MAIKKRAAMVKSTPALIFDFGMWIADCGFLFWNELIFKHLQNHLLIPKSEIHHPKSHYLGPLGELLLLLLPPLLLLLLPPDELRLGVSLRDGALSLRDGAERVSVRVGSERVSLLLGRS